MAPKKSSNPASRTFGWAPLQIQDTEALFNAQNQLALEHTQWTDRSFKTTFEEWKQVLGYPADAERLEFLRSMPSGTTRHGHKLHCLKLTCEEQGKQPVIAGFIDFEVTVLNDANAGKIRQVVIRAIIVRAQMRRQGCGHMLYNAMLEYLADGDLDTIRLYVADINKAAISFYFHLGFKITQWSLREIGEKNKAMIFLLVMQKWEQAGPSKKVPPALQDMPHVFKEGSTGEMVDLVHTDSIGRKTMQKACIKSYDATSKMFQLEYVKQDSKASPRLHGKQTVSAARVCVNDLYSQGQLVFERSPSEQLNQRPACKAWKTWATEAMANGGDGISATASGQPSQQRVQGQRRIATQPSLPQKRTHRDRPRGMRKASLNVFDGGKMMVGLQLDELGYLVRDLAADSQRALAIGEVILAIRGVSFVKADRDDISDEKYRQKAKAKLTKTVGTMAGVAEVIIGRPEVLREQSFQEIQENLQWFFQERASPEKRAKKGVDLD